MNDVFYYPSAMDLNPLRAVNSLPEPVSHTRHWRRNWHRWRDLLRELILLDYGIDVRERAYERNMLVV